MVTATTTGTWHDESGTVYPVLEKPIQNTVTGCEQKCAIEEFFRREREAGRHTSCAFMFCSCPKCATRM